MSTSEQPIERLSGAAQLGGQPEPPSPDAPEWARLRADNERLRDELALRDLALDGIRTTFVIADRTTLEPTIVYCNKAAAEMLGLTS